MRYLPIKLPVRKSLLLLLFSLVIIGMSFSSGYCQEIETQHSDLSYWIHGGTSANTLGIGIQGGLMVDYKNHIFSIRGASTDRDFGVETWDVAFLYGRSISYRTLYMSAGVGVAVIGGTGYSDLFGDKTEMPIETTIGFPIEGQVSWEFTSFLALGIYSFANINTEQPFGGLGLAVRLGQF